MSNSKASWFKTWFDSPYYHILYKNRDHSEAEIFISNLIKFLSPPKDSKILDLACGAGRHAIYLNKLGYDVEGVDLAKNSIEKAKPFENETLHFDTHDMREVYKKQYFDYILSMFTSFGYFDDESDNIEMLQSIEEGLKPNGYFVLDFLNAPVVVDNLIKQETKTLGGVNFYIKKQLENGFIVKHIDFEDKGNKYHFEERVQAFGLAEIEQMLQQTNLKIINTFGDYQLNAFESKTSERLIMVMQKS